MKSPKSRLENIIIICFTEFCLHRLYKKKSNFMTSAKFKYKGLTWTHRAVDKVLFIMDHLCEIVKSFSTVTQLVDENKTQKFKLKANPKHLTNENITLLDDTHDKMENKDMNETIVPFLKNVNITYITLFMLQFYNVKSFIHNNAL